MAQTPTERVYTDADVKAWLAANLPHWQLADGSIRRVYRTSGWQSTLMVANAVAHLAEAAWHHPELVLSYASVEVRLNTHTAKGITDKDFALGQKIEDVVAWQPAHEANTLEGAPAGEYVKYD